MRESLSDGRMDNIEVSEYAVVTWMKESLRDKRNELGDTITLCSRVESFPLAIHTYQGQ